MLSMGLPVQTEKPPMMIIFHVGPHKTGTTSIQRFLLDHYGGKDPTDEIWYPIPEANGPGHALLSWSHEEGAHRLADVVSRAQSAGVRKLLLSSEVFSEWPPDLVENLRQVFQGCETTLVTTQTPLWMRAPSVWQELVKHGWAEPIENSSEKILNSPSMTSEPLTSFARSIDPAKISIIYVHPQDGSQQLIARFLEAARLSNVEPVGLRRNASMGLVEVNLLREFNRLTAGFFAVDEGPMTVFRDPSYLQARKLLVQVLRSQQWKELVPHMPVEPPDSLQKALLCRALELSNSFTALEERWTVEVLGSPNVLALGLEPIDQPEQ